MLSSIQQHFDLPSNRLYRLLERRRREGRQVIDLVSGNVNLQGIFFPARTLQNAMKGGLAAAKTYRPNPLGQLQVRESLSRWYAGEGLKIPAEQLVLTPGTSLSYWYAFKLLANPGDEVLCPTPSYPLFDSIASLGGIKLTSYRLAEERQWKIDFDHLVSALTPRTRAIVLISPHNPTGAVATVEDIEKLAQLAAANHVAIIADEVFSPFLFDLVHLPRPAMTRAPLVITLNGLSKMFALPGMKISWMAVTGEPALVKKSLTILEMISDTFLPVQEAAQFAVPRIFVESRAFQRTYISEIRNRMDVTLKFLRRQERISFVKPGGGFFLTLRLEGQEADEEEIAYRLLKNHGILVHPGYFYDMEGQHLVLSFVSRPAVMRKATEAIQKEIISRIQ